MRQETINIYTIEEHPNKELCFEWMRNNWHDLGEHCIEEMLESLKALEVAVFGKLDYAISIAPDRGEFVKITDYCKETLKELWLKRDIYPLTGVCYDHDVIEGLYHHNLSKKVLNIIHTEGEYIYSNEGLLNICQANGYEFNEDGSIN
jgi:hypothetical protein